MSSYTNPKKYHREYYVSHKAEGRLRSYKHYLKKMYGITFETRTYLLELQNNKCAICGTLETEQKRLCIDHKHKTKKLRGLLCHNCNTGLGHFKEEPLLLAKAIAYLKVHQ